MYNLYNRRAIEEKTIKQMYSKIFVSLSDCLDHHAIFDNDCVEKYFSWT
jgi:hypothetical protein